VIFNKSDPLSEFIDDALLSRWLITSMAAKCRRRPADDISLSGHINSYFAEVCGSLDAVEPISA
jgi:hypothetical protein